MQNFITNSAGKKSLKDRLTTLISVSQELKFLVGFFYFTGWAEIKQALQLNQQAKLRVLVGLQIEELLSHQVVEYEKHLELPDNERADLYIRSLTKALNTDQIDTQEFYDQIGAFIEMIEQNRLVIRKTRNPNHAKLYLFCLNTQQAAIHGTGQFITGSSNLTSAGLHSQEEFNVEIRDYGFDDANAYFEHLWEHSAKLTEEPEKRVKILDYITHKTLAAQVTPYEAYAMVLKAYLDQQQAKELKPQAEELLEKNGFKKFSYQLDAVGQGLEILNQYGGVVVADVVGLGKSVIASLIAKSLDRRTIIICPPGLIGERLNGKATGWWEYVDNFQLNCRVESRGRLEQIAASIDSYDPEVVVVDEAHYFRNQETDDYEYLSKICRNRKVILLSATPFNNSPADIFSLLKLFVVPGKSGITIDENLESTFTDHEKLFRQLSFILKYHQDKDPDKRDKAKKYYVKTLKEELPIDVAKVKQKTKELADKIKSTISPVLIRRNRIDLITDYQYKTEITELSKPLPPCKLLYELDEKQDKFYDRVIGTYFGRDGRFKGAIYQPFKYEKELKDDKLNEEENRAQQQQSNLYDFMRRLLVKRFESSFGAFEQSINRFLTVHQKAKEFIEHTNGRYVLDRDFMLDLLSDKDTRYSSIEGINEALEKFEAEAEQNKKSAKNSKVYDTNKFIKRDEFLAHIEQDIALFETIRAEIAALDLVANDPKRYKIATEIDKILKEDKEGRKIIIFSEYVDTVRHLEPYFKKQFGDRLLVCDGKITREIDAQLNANFNAQFKGKKEDQFDVLITSDKLSEGFNLNRAGAIVNYDIPWNPTRVIQRIGRINRIGNMVFKELLLFNCFPTFKGSQVVPIEETAAQKMFLIHNALGEDAQVFDQGEEPTASKLYNRVNQLPDNDEQESLLTQIRNKYHEIEVNHPEVIAKIANLPNRIKSAKPSTTNKLCVLRKKGLALFTQVVANTFEPKSPAKVISFEEFLPFVECDFETPSMPLSKNFWSCYHQAKELKKSSKGKGFSKNSMEGKAHGSLKVATKILDHTKEEQLFKFMLTLIEDIEQYKTLPDITLAKLARAEITPGASEKQIAAFLAQVEATRQLFGGDYLLKVIEKVRNQRNEIVVAVENITNQ